MCCGRLAEPLRFEPVINGLRRGYQFTGAVELGKLVSGAIELPKARTGMASPTGADQNLRELFALQLRAA